MYKRFWLRKMGTNQVFVWTPILSKRADMKPITEKDADRLQKVFSEEQVKNAAEKRAKKFTTDRRAAEEHEAAVDGEVVDGEGIKLPRSKKGLMEFAADNKIMIEEDKPYKAMKEDVLAALVGQGAAPEPPAEPPAEE